MYHAILLILLLLDYSCYTTRLFSNMMSCTGYTTDNKRQQKRLDFVAQLTQYMRDVIRCQEDIL